MVEGGRRVRGLRMHTHTHKHTRKTRAGIVVVFAMASPPRHLTSTLRQAGASVDARSRLLGARETPLHRLLAAHDNVANDANDDDDDSGSSSTFREDDDDADTDDSGTSVAVAVARLLLDSGAAVNARTRCGMTPLHFAAQGDDAALVRCIQAAGGAADATDRNGMTPLHFAAQCGDAALVRCFLAADGASEATNYDGRTPLHMAALHNSAAACQSLVEDGGAMLDARDADGMTPLELLIAAMASEQNKLLTATEVLLRSLAKGTPTPTTSPRPSIDGMYGAYRLSDGEILA